MRFPSGPSLYSDGSPLPHPIPQSMLPYMKYPFARRMIQWNTATSPALAGSPAPWFTCSYTSPSPVLTYLTSGRGSSAASPGLDQSPASDATASSRVGRVARRVASAAPPSATRREEFDAELGASSRSPSLAARGGASGRARAGRRVPRSAPPRITRTVIPAAAEARVA